MTAKTDRERKQAERERRQALGLKRYELWLHPSQWPAVQRYVARLKRSQSNQNGDV